ncbi:MAG: iron-containing alcohol dehydrogenase [Nitrospirae bacterium]|nr:iron-containing alcohol dehydrogenase [Nitrospirota bacterium]
MVSMTFNFARAPYIHFGAGKFGAIGKIAGKFGKRAVIITGGNSLAESGKMDVLVKLLESESITHYHVGFTGEPSPAIVDGAVSRFADKGIDVIIAIGGGSVLDCGKAISAMLRVGGPVTDYLEGVGTGAAHSGVKVPFIAVPTTAGTGSEATKNAVISHVGPGGFKKSLRHDNFVPDVAIVDPELTLSCPPSVTAACGLDAFTQLLESYVSTKASPMTDALALGALEGMKDDTLLAVCTADGASDVGLREKLAYASLISGITLANAGLGVVHGIASVVGAYFPIPHGVACGTLIGAATRMNVKALKAAIIDGSPKTPEARDAQKAKEVQKAREALDKFAHCAAILAGGVIDDLLDLIDWWIYTLEVPRLGHYGITQSHLDMITSESGNKENPVKLTKDEIREVLLARL